MPRLWLVLFFLLVPSVAEAVAPRAEWRTIVTPRFRIHYHEGTGELAARVSRVAETGLDDLVDVFDHHPSTPIHIVITDETDDANGFAQTLPQNLVTIFAGVPPALTTLGDYDDFMRLLVLHELAHIVHIDTILGIPRWVNIVLGKTMVPNSVQPTWFIEGVAVYLESQLTSGGRVKSAYIDTLVRTQVLTGDFPDVDRLSHFTRTFPGSSYAWFLGGRFVDFIVRRHGEEAIAKMSRAYGARPIPYALNLVAERATGETFVDLYDAWWEEERQRAQAVVDRVTAEGLVQGTAIVRPSPLVEYPRFSSTGELAIVESPRNDDQELVVLDRALERERLRIRVIDGRGSFSPDGKLYLATTRDTVDRVFGHRDLEWIEVSTGDRWFRTEGWRLSEPDVSPDGKTIVAVAQEAGRTRLVTLSAHGEDDPVTLGELEPGEQVYDPRWSPDGRHVAASVLVSDDGGRQIVLFDRDGRRRTLTSGSPRNLTPCWSADGTKVFFTSDRGSVFDIHSVDVTTGELERLTNVVSGAFSPAAHPDGESLVFVHALATGWEIRTLSLVSAKPLAVRAPVPNRTVTATASTDVYPDEPYDPWDTLTPKAWLPSASVDGLGDTFGVILAGNDALKQHAWSLGVRYGIESERIGFDFTYTNRQTWMPLTLSAALAHTTRPGRFSPSVAEDDRLETIFRTRANLTLPLGRWDSGHAISFSYGVETRRGLTLLDPDPQAPSPRGFGDLTLASASASWSFSNARGFSEAVSSLFGNGLSVTLRVHSPLIGSDLRVFDVTAAWTGYLRMPYLKQHVLAARVSMGGAAGDPNGRSVYVLGGLPVRNVVTDAIDGIGFGIDIIRGYERAVFRGNAFYLGTLEYRFPLTSLMQGWATLPVYLDRVHGAVYFDAGAATPTFVDLGTTKAGVGAELRVDLALGYVLPYTLRFGVARGLAQEGIDNVYLVLGGLF